MAIAMAAVFARAQLLTPWKAPVECDIPTVTKLYGTQMSAKAVASTASQRSIKAITPTASQTWWGYFSESNASSLDFSGNLGYGSAVTLNAAIMVEGSNSFVKGSTIKAVRFWLGDDLSAISSDLTLWVSKSLPASASAADYTQTIPKANISSRLNEVELTTPYDATSMQSGDKLYIGFSFSISGRAYPIMAGGTDMSGGFYYNIGSSWIDFVGEGYKNGNLALQLLLDGGTYPTNCASIDNIGQEVVKSGSSVSIPCKITNKGIDDITSLEFTIKDANGSTQTVTRTLSNSLALNNSTGISLSFDAASTPQKSDISVTVTKVNGVDNTLSASDGLKVGTGTLITVSSAPTVVPVVEEFTGTWCGYCPYGTVAMQKAHQQYGDKIVQIAIHSGDPMAVSDYSPVISAYCDGYPNATIDRQSTFHAANIPYRLTSAFNRVSQGMIELTAEWSDAGKTAVKFNTKSTFGYSDNNGQYGIALVLTEDGMTGTSSNWSQNNYLSGGSGDSDMQFWYNSPSTVSGLEYDHVAVAVWNALNGADGSIPSSFTADTPIEYNFTGDISSNTLIQDKTKLKAVALLIDRVSGKIVNAAQCSLSDGSNPAEAYAALSEDNTVLTFYYDANKASRNGMSVGPFTSSYVDGVNKITGREWNDYVSTITKVVFDATFADYMPTSTAYWFYDCNALTTIAGIENLKTDNGTSMDNMLSGCSSLTSLDVSNFNTSNVKDMSLMFYGCSGLTSLDVSNFNTSNVKDMSSMFYGCSGLSSLDVSNFNTDKVMSMNRMFDRCSGLTNLDVSKFNTSNVTDMGSIFYNCSSLTSLDISNFNTDNVASMYGMFWDCSSLTTIKINADNWNTSNVTKSEYMFFRCTKLVGGAGTTFDSNHTDVAYAHIDGGPSNPGYFTDVNAPQDNVTISAKSYTREYGEENPKYEYDVTEGTITSGTPEITCEATAASAVGTYDIVISKGNVSNSNVVLTNGTLTITKAPLTIKSNSYTIKQGEALPEFKTEYEGFKNGENSEVLTKQPVLTTSVTSTSESGTYDIIVSGAEAENYEISYVKGTLTITEAEPVKVTAKSYTIEYGESIPAFEYTSEGAALSGVPEIRCEATAASAAGTYDIVISKGSVSNFNDTYVNGTLTITKAPLVISVGEYTRQEGEENPEFTLTYEGFKNGESDGVLTKLPVVTCVATKDSEPGEYVITIDGAEAENYDIRYASGKLTVTPKPLPEITPIEGEISVNTEGLSETDLTDNVVNDVYYNVGEQGYDATEKSIVISEATNMAQITDKEPGSKDVRDGFNGIIMKVGKGFGLITVSAKTTGNAQLVVQVGQNGMPMIASKTEKGDVVVSYDVSEDTYVYIYAILGSSAAKLMYGDINDTDTDSSVRIYGITVSPGATGIRSVNGNDNGNGNDDAYYTLDGKKLDAAPKKGGIYVKQGRKVVK